MESNTKIDLKMISNKINNLLIDYKDFDLKIESSINRFIHSYQYQLRILINSSLFLVFGYTFIRRRVLLPAVKNTVVYYVFSSILLLRENLNPYLNNKK